MKFLACIAEKCMKKQISEVYEIVAFSEYSCVDILEELTGIKVDGITNYVDYVYLEK